MYCKSGIARFGHISFHAETTERDSEQSLALPQFFHQLVTASVRQADVADEQIEIFLLRFFDGLAGRIGHGNVVTAAFEHHFHSGAGVGVIVDDKKSAPP